MVPLSVRAVKRGIDVVGSSLALIILSPLFVLIAILIKLDSPGPVFYKQHRVKRFIGDNVSPEWDTFEIYKFRSMVNNAEAHTGAVLEVEGDTRITRFGKILRSSRLDELPNLINVLLGQMSLVGPRAERFEIYAQLEDKFPLCWNRTKYIKPGVTGDAQIHLRSNGSLNGNIDFANVLPANDTNQPEDVCRYKMYYDFAYAMKISKFWSFLITDLSIMVKTPYIMFIRRNTI